MTTPEEALEQARRAAAANRGAYGHVDPTRIGPPYEQIAARLSEWAIPDPSGYEIRSIRRFGAPLTWLKRGLVRFLYQFHAQLISDQSRFNVLLLNYVRLLEHRVTDLEGQVRGLSGPLPGEHDATGEHGVAEQPGAAEEFGAAEEHGAAEDVWA